MCGNTDAGSVRGNGNPSQCRAETRMSQDITSIKQDRQMGELKIHAVAVRKMPKDELRACDISLQYSEPNQPLLRPRG
jgi:hypothetical protein